MSCRLDSVKDYILKISAGPSYEKLQVVSVNDEQFPVYINNEYFTGYILVRINGFEGMTREFDASGGSGTATDNTKSIQNKPKQKPDSKYFKNKNRKYSIVIQGRFKHEYHGDQVLFGVDSSSELMPIPGVWVGLR